MPKDMLDGRAVLLRLRDEREEAPLAAPVADAAHHVGLPEARCGLQDGDLGFAVWVLKPAGPLDGLLEPGGGLLVDRRDVQLRVEDIGPGQAIILERVLRLAHGRPPDRTACRSRPG